VHDEPKRRLRVLIADDSDQVRRAVARFLQNTFEVVGAVSSGRGLVHATRALAPDVIVSDLAMPDLTGVEAMRVLRASGNHVPFVLLTAHSSNGQAWIDAGVLGIVDKTDLHEELVPAIEAAAAGRVYLSRHVT
jgi:DNA-binding NarL/FixJ family response regulator